MKVHKSKRGQGLVEYALILSLIALTAVFALTNFGTQVETGLYQGIRDNMQNAEQTISNGESAPSES